MSFDWMLLCLSSPPNVQGFCLSCSVYKCEQQNSYTQMHTYMPDRICFNTSQWWTISVNLCAQCEYTRGFDTHISRYESAQLTVENPLRKMGPWGTTYAGPAQWCTPYVWLQISCKTYAQRWTHLTQQYSSLNAPLSLSLPGRFTRASRIPTMSTRSGAMGLHITECRCGGCGNGCRTVWHSAGSNSTTSWTSPKSRRTKAGNPSIFITDVGNLEESTLLDRCWCLDIPMVSNENQSVQEPKECQRTRNTAGVVLLQSYGLAV